MSAPLEEWPRLVQVGLIFADGDKVTEWQEIVQPVGFTIPQRSIDVHGITTEQATAEGQPLEKVLKKFGGYLKCADLVVCHNYAYDAPIMDREFLHVFGRTFMGRWPSFCTKEAGVNICKIPGNYGKYKWPSLQQLHAHFFGEGFIGAHDAMNDIRATRRCFLEMQKLGVAPTSKKRKP